MQSQNYTWCNIHSRRWLSVYTAQYAKIFVSVLHLIQKVENTSYNNCETYSTVQYLKGQCHEMDVF